MTLILPSQTEARVRSVAELRGQDPEDALIVLLDQALAEAEADLAQIVMTEEESQKVLAALHRSEEDYAAGRWISLEDHEAQLKERRQVRLTKNVPV